MQVGYGTVAGLWSPLLFFESVGRAIVDLGFSGVIEKFEEHWGSRVTRVLLMLVGLAVAAACLGAIWEWIISPLLSFFQTPLWGQTILQLVWTALAIGGGFAVGSLLVSALASFAWSRRARLQLLRAAKLVRRAEATSRKAKSETDELIEKASELIQDGNQVTDAANRAIELAATAIRGFLDGSFDDADKNQLRLALEQIEAEVDKLKERGDEPEVRPAIEGNDRR